MRYLNLIGYVCIPFAYACHHWFGHGQSWEPVATFILAALGVIPLAHLMGESTEHLAERTGPTWGGLLNATFGNAAELIIAIIALYKGLNEIVMASLTGSILGNLLLVAGAAIVVGGWKREKQVFNRFSAETNAALLTLAVAAMLFPAIFDFTFGLHDLQARIHGSTPSIAVAPSVAPAPIPAPTTVTAVSLAPTTNRTALPPDVRTGEHKISLVTSVILLAVYGAGLLFTLRTHHHIFSPKPATSEEDPQGVAAVTGGHWTVRKSVILLLLASVGIGLVAELLVSSAEQMAHQLGWNQIFVGVILLAIIGNAAEHSTAVLLAKRDDMDTAMTICYQSSLQIALFATPALVLTSAAMTFFGMGHAHNLDLIFSPMEVAAVMLAVFIVIVVHGNGQTNWLEGVLLLALYAILGTAFFYIPTTGHGE